MDRTMVKRLAVTALASGVMLAGYALYQSYDEDFVKAVRLWSFLFLSRTNSSALISRTITYVLVSLNHVEKRTFGEETDQEK